MQSNNLKDLPRNTDGVKIEVCVDSIESALAAVRGGADRLEICGNLALGGGTTPSTGLVRLIKNHSPPHIELMTMIRPRTGDFLYTPHELSVMLEDIRVFSGLGITGVVFGVLTADATVDVEKTNTLVDEAVSLGLQVCFHRAFDMVVDQQEALSALRHIPGITRVLTSGGKPTAPLGLQSLTSLLASPRHHSPPPAPASVLEIEIMPGAGVSPSTAPHILRALLPLPSSTLAGVGVRSIHLSGGRFVPSEIRGHRPAGMGFGVGGEGEWGVWRTSEEVMRAVREVVDREWEAYVQDLQEQSSEPGLGLGV